MKTPYTSLAKRLNAKETAANADSVLRDYQDMKALAYRTDGLKSVRLSDMPSGSSDPKIAEKIMIKQLNAAEYIEACQKALAAVKELNENWGQILRYLYFGPILTPTQLQERNALEHSAFYAARRKALVAFAEAFPDKWGELLVFND